MLQDPMPALPRDQKPGQQEAGPLLQDTCQPPTRWESVRATRPQAHPSACTVPGPGRSQGAGQRVPTTEASNHRAAPGTWGRRITENRDAHPAGAAQAMAGRHANFRPPVTWKTRTSCAALSATAATSPRQTPAPQLPCPLSPPHSPCVPGLPNREALSRVPVRGQICQDR